MNYLNLHFSLSPDPLSLFFVFVILLISLPSAVYSAGYLKHGYPARKIILGWALLAAFVASMLLLVLVNNMLAFLILWEIMSLVSFFLVVFDSRDRQSVKAGLIYIIMTHIGTAFITVAFLLLYRAAGSFDYETAKHACLAMPGAEKNIVFLCLLAGFGVKAGIVPLHIWLPYAHPQAPSHISGIMSGVMIKTAIYGIIRFVVLLLGVNSLWWGNLVLVLGAVSCLVGVLYALAEHDIKKLLAYSSIENIGIILLGVGSSMVFSALSAPSLALLALTAGLYHLVNHALFKNLLFLCSGSIYKATGTRDMEKFGGLIKTMPWTAAFFLIGSMAISALPPLNGFVSEWLTLQALFSGTLAGPAGTRILMSACAVALALTGGLAAACFVKAFGITFLALPRSAEAENAREAPISMLLPMGFTAFLAIAFGVFAVRVLKTLTAVSRYALGLEGGRINFTVGGLFISPAYQGAPLISPLVIAAMLALLGGIAFAAVRLLFGKRKTVAGGTWDCGYYSVGARNEYTAGAFSKPFRIAFSSFYLPVRSIEVVKESFYHVRSIRHATSVTMVFRNAYQSVIKRAFSAAGFMSRIQSGSIHLYLAYIFVTVVVLVIFNGIF